VLLLPIAALAVMAFFLVLLMMTVAGACERREQQRLASPREPMFCGLSLSAANENARLVWATQLPMLERLAIAPMLPESLHSAYAAMARHYPALYEGRHFEEWLQFLENSRVVCYRQGRLQLAAHGQSLLDQCRNAYRRNSQSLR
jgi:hypothetical protein